MFVSNYLVVELKFDRGPHWKLESAELGLVQSSIGYNVQCYAMHNRDGAVHKNFVHKLHRTAQFYPHASL